MASQYAGQSVTQLLNTLASEKAAQAKYEKYKKAFDKARSSGKFSATVGSMIVTLEDRYIVRDSLNKNIGYLWPKYVEYRIHGKSFGLYAGPDPAYIRGGQVKLDACFSLTNLNTISRENSANLTRTNANIRALNYALGIKDTVAPAGGSGGGGGGGGGGDTGGGGGTEETRTSGRTGNLVYNVASVKESYFHDKTSFTNASGNAPKAAIAKALDLWKSSSNHKGMIATWTPVSSASNPPGSGITANAQTRVDKNKYAFQFLYNPGQITMAYKGTPAIDVTQYTSGSEDFANWTSADGGGTINFELVLNRMFDMKYYDKHGKLTKNRAYAGRVPKNSANKGTLFDEQKAIFNRGTMYDVEFLLRTTLGYTIPTQFRGNTADIGWLGGMPVEVHLGPGLRYWGTLSGFTVNHVIFDERMVPVFSTVNISINRIPDYATLPGATTDPGGGGGDPQPPARADLGTGNNGVIYTGGTGGVRFP